MSTDVDDRFVAAARLLLGRATKYAADVDGVGSITVEATDASLERWAIRSNGNVMNRAGQWEYEPLPSSRTPAFYKRTRFDLVAALHRAGAHRIADAVAIVRGVEADDAEGGAK